MARCFASLIFSLKLESPISVSEYYIYHATSFFFLSFIPSFFPSFSLYFVKDKLKSKDVSDAGALWNLS